MILEQFILNHSQSLRRRFYILSGICCKSFGIAGGDGYVVEIETDTIYGKPSISIIGLGDLAIKEASERNQASIIQGGFEFPKMKIINNLVPSDIKKRGSHFDLAIAIGLLKQTNQIVAQG